jgi:acetyltransferase
MVELLRDRALELPPLNQFLARRLIERSRIAEMLGPWRGAPAVAVEALEQILLRVSEMVCALPQLREMDINPILVDEQGAIAVDARVVVAPPSGAPGSLQHLAILPYPAGLEHEVPLKGGGRYTIRPVHPDDAEMLQTLVRELSPESRYFRFASHMPELPPRLLARFTLIDYDREMALVAVRRDTAPGPDGTPVERERVIGVARYITQLDPGRGEFSLVVADDHAGQGIGRRLMQNLHDIARSRGLTQLVGLVLTNNAAMLRLMRALGYSVGAFPEDPDFRLVTRAL